MDTSTEKANVLDALYEKYRHTTHDGEPLLGVNRVVVVNDGVRKEMTNLVYGRGEIICLMD